MVDELAGLGCRRVGILGGEPLLLPDLPEIIQRVRHRGMACVVVTNGLLVKRRIDDLRLASTLVLSLDGVGEANDAVRGEGVFEAAKEAIASARAAGIPMKLNAVLSATTAPGIEGLMAFVERYDLRITVNVMRVGSPELCHEAASIKAGDEEIRKTFEWLTDASRKNPRILFSEATYRLGALWRDYSVDRLEADELAEHESIDRAYQSCQAGRYYLSINPDGTVSPCAITAMEFPEVSVLAGGVESAWRRLHDHGCAACYASCLVELNSLFSLHPRVVFNFVRRYLPTYR